MPDNIPQFTAKPIDEEAEIKTEETPALKKTPRKLSRAKSIIKKVKEKVKKTDSKDSAIEKQLVYIYQDNNGNLPDMKNIKIKKGQPAVLKFFFLFLIIGGLLAGTAWAGFFIFPNNKKFSEEQVNLAINGPTEVTAGVPSTYFITYKNDLGINLQTATLNLQYPEGFVFISSDPVAKNAGHTEWSLGNIPPYKKREIKIVGINYGSIGQGKSFRAFLAYKPENMASELQKSATLSTIVNSSPIALSLSSPEKVSLGSIAEYTFIVKKDTASQINKLEIKPILPANFHISSSEPKLNKENKWIFDLGKLSTSTANLTEWPFKISGKFSSSSEQAAVISGELSALMIGGQYLLAQTKGSSELTQSNLDFILAINGSTKNQSSVPGDTLDIALQIKNTNIDAMKNATVKLTLDAPSYNRQSVLDWPKIEEKYDAEIRGAQIDETTRRGELTWTKAKIADMANIAKGTEFMIEMKLPIRDGSSFSITELKGYKIIANAEILYTDKTGQQTLSSNPIEIILNSNLKFESRDAASGYTHDITWVLNNDFHPLKNISLSADIYGNVIWDGPDPVPAGTLNYEMGAQKIIWTIPEMPAETDVLALPFSLTLNTLNPTQEILISKVRVQAEDSVTGEKIEFMGDETPLK